MKDKILIKIYDNSLNITKYLVNKEIDFLNIKEYKNYSTLYISKSDLKNIYMHYEILKEYSIKNIIYILKNKIYYIFLLFMGIIIFSIFSNIIVDVQINTNDTEIIKKISKSLDNYGIKRLTFKKNYNDIKTIKDSILNELKDNIEWLEIENIGMTYKIKLEERKEKNKDNNNTNCDVVSTSDGIITKIISNKGSVLVKDNQLIKEGNVLISGHIMLNDEEKRSVCASGEVYAEKWFSVTLDIPLIYQEKIYTGKIKNNIILEYDNRDFKIFKSRVKMFDEEKKEILSLLNKKIILVKEKEYKLVSKKYDEDALNKRIDELVIEKLSLNLKENERIIDKKVLKKEVNDSRIKIELFTIVEKKISKQVTY